MRNILASLMVMLLSAICQAQPTQTNIYADNIMIVFDASGSMGYAMSQSDSRSRLPIAQVMINRPRLTIMDEPFSALDEANKEKQQRLLLTLRAENEAFKAKGEEPPYTFMIVTHEINEAIYVGDRVIGLSQHWDWKSEGHDACPGARIVYDRPAPVFSPYDVVHYGDFVEQKSDILKTVFNKSNVRESWQEKVEKAKV